MNNFNIGLLVAACGLVIAFSLPCLAVADDSGENMALALRDAINNTPFAALATHTAVERLPLPANEHGNEEILRYSLDVSETFRGTATHHLRYDMIVEKGESATIDQGAVIITLCLSDQGYYWPGTGSIFPANDPLTQIAKEAAATAQPNQRQFEYCE